jgi:spermidine synthase
MLCLRRRELLSRPGTIVTEVTLNHEFLMSSLYTDSERALARTALQMHSGEDLRVLVGGLGLGYTAREALLSNRVAQVEVMELLPQVIDWLDEGLVPLASELRGERRLVVTQGDVFQRLAGPPDDLLDLILIDVDHSPEDKLNDQSVSFYTTQGICLLCQWHMQDDLNRRQQRQQRGVLSVSSVLLVATHEFEDRSSTSNAITLTASWWGLSPVV